MTVALQVSAETAFRTSELRRLATTLTIDTESLPEGYSHPKANSLTLTVHMENRTIDHIGLCLFTEEIRTIGKSPIFDFLERYFLQLKYPPQLQSMANMMRDDQFHFHVGNIATVDDILPSDGFSYEFDHHRYQATWNRNGQKFLSVSFPVEYELISGENKIEAENNLPADIQNTKINIPTDSQPLQKNDSCYTSDFRNRLYYKGHHLIVSDKHPLESAANIMLSQQAPGDYKISLTQLSYGFRKTLIEVPLHQWISFCQNHGCELFFGVEQMTPDGDIDCVVMAVNTAENYNHVLTVRIPAKVIDAQRGTIEARLYPYVPTHNVLNMFAAYRKSNPKTFVSK